MAKSHNRRLSVPELPELDCDAKISYAVFHPRDTAPMDELYARMKKMALECSNRQFRLEGQYHKLADAHSHMTAQLTHLSRELETINADLVEGMRKDLLDFTDKLQALLTRHRPSGQHSAQQ
ncbi:hypothetical protein MMC07_004435 [Pseudocyphellaria aurata]|nr:hypothetical protein [Pseudocyphellaria aurata]